MSSVPRLVLSPFSQISNSPSNDIHGSQYLDFGRLSFFYFNIVHLPVLCGSSDVKTFPLHCTPLDFNV